MKKLLKTLFAFAIVVSMSVLASCGGAPSNEEVGKLLEKYNDEGELTQAEYGMLIDYIDAVSDDALPLAKKLNAAYKEDDMDKVSDLMDEAAELEGKYPYAEAVLAIIEHTSDEELGEANCKKGEKVIEKMMSTYD